MKIASISTCVLRLPFSHDGPPLHFAGRPRNGMEMLLVRVDTDDGITGWGEAFGPGIWPATRAVIETIVTPMCIGRDSTKIAALSEDLQRNLHPLGRSGPVIFALAGLDIALWDIAGKRAEKPLARLLAADPRTELTAYASLLRYDNSEFVARKCAEALGRGYRRVKLHETGVAQTRAAREAAGPGAGLMLDANCPWSVDQAVDIARQLREFNLLWLEEPIWPPEDCRGLAMVRQQGGIPVAAGENAASVTEFSNLMAAHAVDYAQPSIIKLGGVTPMVRVMELARQHGIGVMPHSPYFGPGFIATLHVCAAHPGDTMIERYYCDLDASPLGAAINPVSGRIAVPQGPGLGIDPDPGVLREFQLR
jgi:D-galactarolactone cycloisomerase